MVSKPVISHLVLERSWRATIYKTADLSCTTKVRKLGIVFFRSVYGNIVLMVLCSSENVNREDVCDLVLDADSVTAFETAVDRQVHLIFV